VHEWDIVGDTGEVRRYELSEENWKEGHYGDVAYNADGAIIVCWNGADAILVLLTNDNSQPVNRIRIDPAMKFKMFSLDCDHDQMAALLTPWNKAAVVKYWRIDTGEEIKSLQITTDEIDEAVFAKKNTMVVTRDGRNMCVWNLEGDRAALETTIDAGRTFDVTRSGDVIAVEYLDNAIRFFDAHTGAKLAVYRGHSELIKSLRFSPQGDRLVSTSYLDGTTRVWDTTIDALSANSPSATDGCCFTRVEFTPNGKYIAAIAYDDPRVLVFDGETGKYLTTLVGHAKSVAAIAFSAVGSILASVSENGVVFLWDMRQEVMHPWILSQSNTTESLEPVDMTFNASGNLLAIFYKDDKSFMVKLHDVSNRNGADVGVELFQSKPNDGDLPHLIRFSRDEPLVRIRHVTPGDEVRIWDHATETVQELAYDESAHSTWVLPFHVQDDLWNDWIYSRRTKLRLFWLPRDRRPSNSNCMSMHGDRLAIGTEYGVFTLLNMSRLQMSGN
jgi:WD40 repeat protein